MYIPKYIGLFLLKNHFCYLHGLGNLELRKKPAVYDGKMLHASSYEIFVSSAGSIDDNLANFIASNEQITISKASAALRDFSNEAKHELQEGREVIIPFIGKLLEEYGRIIFITDPHLQFAPAPRAAERSDILPEDAYYAPPPPPPIEEPVYQEPKREEEYSHHRSSRSSRRSQRREQEPEETGINWKKVIWSVLILISIVAGAIYGIRLLKTPDDFTRVDHTPAAVIDSSMLRPRPDTIAAAADNNELKMYRVVIDNYANRKKAEKRADQMKGYGHNVEVLAKDSSSFLIIMPVRCKASDTTQVLDSLGRLFNPAGVTLY